MWQPRGHAGPFHSLVQWLSPRLTPSLSLPSPPLQPAVGLNEHRGHRLAAPEKQTCAGPTHISSLGPRPGTLQLGRVSGPPPDAVYPPAQFQQGFLPPRHNGPPVRPPEGSEVPPGHMYRPYKYLNRAHPALWNGSHGPASQGAMGPEEKSPMGPGPSLQPRGMGHMMDPRAMRPTLPPSQWTEQPNFLPHGVPPSGYIRPPGKATSQRMPQPTATLFGGQPQVQRGCQGGDSMMDSPEMIAMQQLSSRVCPPGVPYHPRQPPPPHLPGPFPQLAHAASTAGVQPPKPVVGNGSSQELTGQTMKPETNQGNTSSTHLPTRQPLPVGFELPCLHLLPASPCSPSFCLLPGIPPTCCTFSPARADPLPAGPCLRGGHGGTPRTALLLLGSSLVGSQT